ncbi:hypothetical protein D5R93_00785 [Actinomyces lilanjuaniae]|uniref:Type II restriction enzyme NaeI domain-containing protein n=1 Tax=Actinomyces lilanjuaniae TaxID=2321394 RepID=A0ABN5PQL1_9ACTO|nr:NaeI family type II restriction endonuclease [Actinomyces lilanjuaniae]AYD88955.1 hypothetical protein D5R93_00785 [Actinomyces lilanjuaniae]
MPGWAGRCRHRDGGRAADRRAAWSIGVVRATEENRRMSVNRDRKTSLSAHGRSQVTWLFRDAPMQPNVLLQLPPTVVSLHRVRR